jgi:hypothetical protein
MNLKVQRFNKVRFRGVEKKLGIFLIVGTKRIGDFYGFDFL